MKGKATMSKLVTLEAGGIADFGGATIHEQQRGSDLLYLTERTGLYVLGVNAGRNLPHGLQAHVTYRYLSHQEAAEWLIENDHEVPQNCWIASKSSKGNHVHWDARSARTPRAVPDGGHSKCSAI